MKFIRISIILLSCSLLVNSCIKQAFDAPPDTIHYDPNLPVQATLKQISTMGANMSSGKSRVMGDTTVYGIVVADDKSGNYYKQIVIEDTSMGGLVVYIDKSYLYNDYPVGRKIYLNLKGLTLANYNGLPEIVYTADQAGVTVPIPSGLVGNYITKASYPNTTVGTQNVTLEQIKSNPNAYLNTLITLSNVQFDAVSNGIVYADPSSSASATNRTVEKCDHSASATVRTSGYCNFQNYKTPVGNGTLTVICSIYGGTLQLIIRDTTDVRMYATRCP